MSKLHTLRSLVNERLTAAAEEIFVLVERTILEYEEEMCRCKEETKWKPEPRVDSGLCPKIVLVRGGVQIPSTTTCPDPNVKMETSEDPQIKEEPQEQSIKQEEEQLPDFPGRGAKWAKLESRPGSPPPAVDEAPPVPPAVPPSTVVPPEDWESESEPEQSNMEPDYTPPGSGRRRKKATLRVATSLTEEQKDEVITFLKANPCIYSRRLNNFKNIPMKATLWKQQARLMGVSAQQIRVWYDSMRTRMGKLKKAVVVLGQSIKNFTPTEAWIWKHFQFLNEHISTHSYRHMVNLKSAAESREQEQSQPSVSTSARASEPLKSATPPLVTTTAPSGVSQVPSCQSAAALDRLKEFLQEQSATGASFGTIVDRILDSLQTDLRRMTEIRILSTLREALASDLSLRQALDEGERQQQNMSLHSAARSQSTPSGPHQDSVNHQTPTESFLSLLVHLEAGTEPHKH